MLPYSMCIHPFHNGITPGLRNGRQGCWGLGHARTNATYECILHPCCIGLGMPLITYKNLQFLTYTSWLFTTLW